MLFHINQHICRVKYKAKVVFFTMFVLQANDSPGTLQIFLEGLYSNYKERIAGLKRQIIRTIKMSRLNIGLCLCGLLDYSSSKLSSSQKQNMFEVEGSNCISHLECRRRKKNHLFLGIVTVSK